MPRSTNGKKALKLDEERKVVMLPCYGPLPCKIGRLASECELQPVSCPLNKCKHWLCPIIDYLGLRTPGIYKVPCTCGMVHVE